VIAGASPPVAARLRPQLGVEPATRALVGQRRVVVTGAQDDAAARQRGTDDGGDQLGARRLHQQRLGHRLRRRMRFEQQCPDALGERRAARLARADDALAARAQALGERRDVGRLAGAVDAFEGDEAARHGELLRWNRFTARL
jgi:hypothetical protein